MKASNRFFLNFLCATIFIAPLLAGPAAFAQIPGLTSTQKETAEPAAVEDPLGRNTPRGSVSNFISAVAEQDYLRAGEYLNMPKRSGNSHERERLARVLQRLLDQGELLHFSRISDKPAGNTADRLPPGVDRVGSVTAGGERIDLLVEASATADGDTIWLFSSETIKAIAEISFEDDLLIERLLPAFLQENLWYGVPAGHWLIAVILALLAYFVVWAVISFIIFLIPKFWRQASTEPTAGIIRALAVPIKLYIALWLFVAASIELGVSIILRQRFSTLTDVIGVVVILILLWRLAGFLGRFTKSRMEHKGSPSGISVVLFLQRLTRITIVIIGVIAILKVFGIDVTAWLAALGIVGIAIALGAQKSMENFVGSVTLIADQPIRVGDFCKVGEVTGTVESIGMRSTRIRTLNRTVITIPNGKFSSDQIENYAHRDQFLLRNTLSLRYETTPDQIRYLLVELRKMLYSHPKVNPEPARVRFIELGADSINIELYAYILADNFSDFLSIKEDLLLRAMDIVEESGTGFAFPSQTIYLAKDHGLSKEKSKDAEEQVKKWREQNNLPIPDFDPDNIQGLSNTLSYPPEGSVKKNDEGPQV